jgi:hypothetical protein
LEEAIIEIGYIKHIFPKINVAIVELTLPLTINDHIQIRGPLTDFEQIVESLQINRKNVTRAQGGQSAGLLVSQPVHEKDTVYKKL